MFLVPIALIVAIVGLIRFFEWVALSCIYIDIVLDGSITKMQCSMFSAERAMNKVSVCKINPILSYKQQ